MYKKYAPHICLLLTPWTGNFDHFPNTSNSCLFHCTNSDFRVTVDVEKSAPNNLKMI